MSNPQHPCFAGATSVGPDVLPVAMPARADDAVRMVARVTSARTWSVGVSLASLGLWGFLLVALTNNLATPTMF
jgi:hypothetical protein